MARLHARYHRRHGQPGHARRGFQRPHHLFGPGKAAARPLLRRSAADFRLLQTQPLPRRGVAARLWVVRFHDHRAQSALNVHSAGNRTMALVRASLVSTVIPVYNRAAMLREAVASVLAQTWRPIEIIIVDDGSTDETAAVAEELAAGNPGIIRVLRQANAGPGAARQVGLEASSGEFVQFLDSD